MVLCPDSGCVAGSAGLDAALLWAPLPLLADSLGGGGWVGVLVGLISAAHSAGQLVSPTTDRSMIIMV